MDTESDEKVAIKIMKMKWKDDSIDTEVKYLEMLDHQNIIKMIGHGHDQILKSKGKEDEIIQYIVLEPCLGGMLFEYAFHIGRFSDSICRNLFKQLLSALEYMHSKGVYHMDIKPENIVFDSDFNLKLIDFGLSTEKTTSTQRCGTPDYHSPELYMDQEYSPRGVDLYASGMVLFIMKTGVSPFDFPSEMDPLYRYIAADNFKKFWKKHSKKLNDELDIFDDEFKDLITGILKYNPEDRITMEEMLAHPWMQGETATSEELKEELSTRKKKLPPSKPVKFDCLDIKNFFDYDIYDY